MTIEERRANLRMARRHVAEAQQRLVAQHPLVQRLAAVCGNRTAPVLRLATEMLQAFQRTVQVMRDQLQVEKDLAKRSHHS